jgi:hypothetical protein
MFENPQPANTLGEGGNAVVQNLTSFRKYVFSVNAK